MEAKTKLIPAMLVQMDAGLLREATDYMALSRTSNVTFQVVNGICVGIDTSQKLPKLLTSDVHNLHVIPFLEDAPLDDDTILDFIRKRNNATTVKDFIESFKNNTTGFKKFITGRLISLRRSGKVIAQKNHHGHYVINSYGGRAERKRVLHAITADGILKFLAEGPLTSRDISDRYGIGRKDVSMRQKVTVCIRGLMANGQIQSKERKAGMRLYQLKAVVRKAPAAPAKAENAG